LFRITTVFALSYDFTHDFAGEGVRGEKEDQRKWEKTVEE